MYKLFIYNMMRNASRRTPLLGEKAARPLNAGSTPEEFYKLLKSDAFSLRQMHAKSVLGVEQELFAQLTLAAIARLLAANAVAEHLNVQQDISPKAGVLAIATGIVRLMLCDDPEQRLEHHASLLRQLARRRLKTRPGRSSPRISFKPGPR